MAMCITSPFNEPFTHPPQFTTIRNHLCSLTRSSMYVHLLGNELSCYTTKQIRKRSAKPTTQDQPSLSPGVILDSGQRSTRAVLALPLCTHRIGELRFK